MSRLTRFEQIEPEHAGTAAPATPSAPDPAREGRFGAADDAPHVLDLSAGQPFVRCAVCKGDSHATALACCRCQARLDTPEQRAFNEAFWARRQAEDAELRAEADRLRTARAEADRAAAEARKYVEWMDGAIALRRARRLTRREGEVVVTFEPDLRRLGLAIGRFLRRMAQAGARLRQAARAVLLRDPGK
jgi:hypothetical protein